MIPKDPVILLSYVNTQLRDYYESLEALCTCRAVSYTHLDVYKRQLYENIKLQ